MDLSIVIASWNTRAILEACLESIARAPSRHRREVIVVDNGSTDGSPEMVTERFPEVRLVRNARNRGFAAACNQGLALARGRHLLLLNSDTEILGGVLDASVDALDARPRTGILGCRVLETDGRTTQPTCFRFPGVTDLAILALGLHRLRRPRLVARQLGRQHYEGWARDTERPVDVVTGCFLLARRAVLEQIGPLDERYVFYGEETDFCRRAADAGWDVRFVPCGEIVHHGGASTLPIAGERGLLLGAAIVRLLRTHGGPVRGGAAWTILLTAHVARATALGLAGILRRDHALRARARAAWHVARRFHRAWTGRAALPTTVAGAAAP